MFGKFFGQSADDEARKAGKILFQEGMRLALAYDTEGAIDCYTRSFALSPNPSPLINRANLLSKRLRYAEALRDLLEAKRLDDLGGREFTRTLEEEISTTEIITGNYRNGMREQLLSEFDPDRISYVSGRIISASFNIENWSKGIFDRGMLEFHFFNDLDNIIKFDDVTDYPNVAAILDSYDADFIDYKISLCPNFTSYSIYEGTLHGMLCIYDVEIMKSLRNTMLSGLHQRLLYKDYGMAYAPSPVSAGEAVIKEAKYFKV